MFLEVDGGEIYYEISEDLSSTKKPVIFLLPGGPGGAHGIYKFHSLDLENFFCVVYHDPRCCGKSQNFDPSSATMKNYISDVENLRSHLKLNKIFMLGTSYGSMCAIGYAIKFASYLSQLILIAGAASYRFLEIAKLNLERCGTLEQKEICKYLWSGTFKNDDHVSEFIKVMKSMYSMNSDFINSTTMGKSVPSFSYKVLNLGFGDFLRHFDYEAELNKISCKTLIIVGKDDWINDPSQLKIVASKISDAKLEVLDNCGHFVAIDQHQRYINLIKNSIPVS